MITDELWNKLKIAVNHEELENANNFEYLRPTITSQGGCTVEVKSRSAVASQKLEKYVASYQQENKTTFNKSLHIPGDKVKMRNVVHITRKENNSTGKERL